MPVGDPSPSPVPNQRFRKAERLLRRADYLRVQTTGDRFRTHRVAITCTPSPEGRTRLGVTVSKKVGNSPTRSLVKRWIREAFRLNKQAWPPGTDFVVIARPTAARAGFHALQADLLRWAAEQRARSGA